MPAIQVTPLGWKSTEGYDAVQGADGRRYYQVGGILLDPQTGAQVGNPAGPTPSMGGAPGGAVSMAPNRGPMMQGGPAMQYQPGGYPQMPGYPGAPRRAPDGMNLIYPDGSQTQIGVFNRGPQVQGGPYMQYQPAPGYPQMPGYPGGAKQQGGPYMAYGQPQPQQRAAVQPYQRPSVPLAHQVNPAVWDSLGPVGREMAYGAIAGTGQDPGQYEYDLNQSRPKGTAPAGTNYRYASSRGFGGF